MMSLCFGSIPLSFGITFYVVVITLLLVWNLVRKNTKQFNRFLTMAGISSLLIIALVILFLFFYAYLGCNESWWAELLIIVIGLPLTYLLAYTESKKPRILSAKIIKSCRLLGLFIFAAGSALTLFVAYVFLGSYF